jgi:hypothetical protein
MEDKLLRIIINIWHKHQKGKKPSIEVPMDLPNFVDGILADEQLGKGDSGAKPERKKPRRPKWQKLKLKQKQL